MEKQGVEFYITEGSIKKARKLKRALRKLSQATERARIGIEEVREAYKEVLELESIEIEIKVKEPKGGEKKWGKK